MNARTQRTSRSLSVGEMLLSDRQRLCKGSARVLFSPLIFSRSFRLGSLDHAGIRLIESYQGIECGWVQGKNSLPEIVIVK